MYWVIYFDEIAESFWTLKEAQGYIEGEAEPEDINDYWIIKGDRIS